MGSINLYKIDSQKRDYLIPELSTKLREIDTRDVLSVNPNNEEETLSMTLYVSYTQHDHELSWQWLLDEFEQPEITVVSSPKAVVLIEKEDNATYAATFGNSFFLVDKYCDRNFGFAFAKKLDYNEIKTTTLMTPVSRKNKTINSYINYNELEFDSGESFSKIKAKALLPNEFSLFKPTLEVGSSIKFSTSNDSLTTLAEIVFYVEKILLYENDKHDIPLFTKVTDGDLIRVLDSRFENSERENPQVNISELDIVGSTEIFNRNDSEFTIKYGTHEKNITCLNEDELRHFCTENGLNYNHCFLDIKVISLQNGTPVCTNKVREIIDYTDDDYRCLLSKGNWYRYNDDYLTYLERSVSEIKAEYHPEYDFSNEIHDAFIETKYTEERHSPEYATKSEEEIKKSLKTKYYAERTFNLIRSSDDGFANYDREGRKVGDSKIELMDLYRDRCMFAVKIGKTSSKLCYTVDQSLESLKMYQHHQLDGMPEIDKVCIWIVLDQETHIENEDGIPELSRLNLLLLKTKLDQWKKEVRLQGLKPLIYVNYRN